MWENKLCLRLLDIGTISLFSDILFIFTFTSNEILLFVSVFYFCTVHANNKVQYYVRFVSNSEQALGKNFRTKNHNAFVRSLMFGRSTMGWWWLSNDEVNLIIISDQLWSTQHFRFVFSEDSIHPSIHRIFSITRVTFHPSSAFLPDVYRVPLKFLSSTTTSKECGRTFTADGQQNTAILVHQWSPQLVVVIS